MDNNQLKAILAKFINANNISDGEIDNIVLAMRETWNAAVHKCWQTSCVEPVFKNYGSESCYENEIKKESIMQNIIDVPTATIRVNEDHQPVSVKRSTRTIKSHPKITQRMARMANKAVMAVKREEAIKKALKEYLNREQWEQFLSDNKSDIKKGYIIVSVLQSNLINIFGVIVQLKRKVTKTGGKTELWKTEISNKLKEMGFVYMKGDRRYSHANGLKKK